MRGSNPKEGEKKNSLWGRVREGVVNKFLVNKRGIP